MTIENRSIAQRTAQDLVGHRWTVADVDAAKWGGMLVDLG